MHEVVLLRSRVASLEEANQTLSKRRQIKKVHLQEGGSLTKQDAQDLLDQKEAEQQLQQETCQNRSRQRRAAGGKRRCSKCGKPGHNARTCQQASEEAEESCIECS